MKNIVPGNIRWYDNFKLFGELSNIILEVDMTLAMGSSQLLLMEFIFSIRKAELLVAIQHMYTFLWMGHGKYITIEMKMMDMILLLQQHNLNWRRETL